MNGLLFAAVCWLLAWKLVEENPDGLTAECEAHAKSAKALELIAMCLKENLPLTAKQIAINALNRYYKLRKLPSTGAR